MEKTNNPLVSIGVITFNSSKWVIDTLESIKNQTYQNIELIVSDDCSTDNTVAICKEWIANNKVRFVNTNVIVPKCNTGIPANANRAVIASSGIWCKLIAGDDMLLPDAIEKYINYVINKEGIQLVFAKSLSFYVVDNREIEEPFGYVDKESIEFFNSLSSREQYLAFLNDKAKCGGGTPTAFIKKDLLNSYPFNERYKGFEDVPEWIKLTKNGVHLNCMDEFTVKYRRGDSITSSNTRFFSPVYWASKHQYFWDELINYLKEENLYETYNRKRKELLRIELLDLLTKNKVSIFNKIIKEMIYRLLIFINFPKWN